MRLLMVLMTITLAAPAAAQTTPRRVSPPTGAAMAAEMAVKRAIEQMEQERKLLARDLAVLRRLQIADDALVDPMQPSNAIQKAYEEVDAAKALGAPMEVMLGIVKVHSALSDARRSPGAADFGRLRAILRSEAEDPATNLVLRNSTRLEEETLMWIKVQELISQHLRTLSELAGEGLRAAQK